MVRDPVTNATGDIPGCTTPRLTLAVGSAASEARVQYGILSGDVANVTLVRTPTDVRRRALAEGLAAPQFSPKRVGGIRLAKDQKEQKEIYTGTPIDLRSVVYIVDLSSCNASDPGWRPGVTKEAIQNYVLFNNSSPVSNALDRFYTTCSYNKTFFKPSNVTVVGPVSLPCSGWIPRNTTAGAATVERTNATVQDWWDFSAFCGASEQAAWQRGTEAWATNASNSDPKLAALTRTAVDRRRNIYILPTNVKCPWEGYGDVTCTKPICDTFIRSSSAVSSSFGAAAFLHEQMHNYGLEHSGRGADPYGDDADVMGNFLPAGNALMCHNAPSMWRVGWATPIVDPRNSSPLFGNLTSANFSMSSNVLTLTVPSAHVSDANMVVVNLGAADNSKFSSGIPGVDTYYISYRVKAATAGAFDGGLPSKYNRTMFIHRYNGVQDERVFGARPTQLYTSSMSGTKIWYSTSASNFTIAADGTGGGLRVTLVNANSTHATVQICKMFSIQEICGASKSDDGVDHDCDGLPDCSDPDCLPCF
ncbi:hypothetical protein GPECTOR_63g68 [Gonium pectorale]|uniref:Peptidase M11 gametolysin domain-containing protein n=1 Tax=Gonium pectorale TaxID=33097 RepID=A0A150G4N5_GONPE|nr:hypothetical protein GPECTOR_63g68 [Gonium pectorale]|eukprot:KXZ44743.1 hypothetical protein GPECTOR_63g68 [Gonium pectorale]